MQIKKDLHHDALAAPRWAARRLRQGVAAATIAQDVAAARRAAERSDPRAERALQTTLLADVIVGARKLEGPGPLRKGAVPMSLAEYEHLVTRGTLECRQALALMWMRAARTADVLAMKAGSLWMDGDGLGMELGSEKSRKLGVPGFLRVHLPSREAELVGPLLSRSPPDSHPNTRPALLDLNYHLFRAYILLNRPPASRVTPHSVRKGAIMQMVSNGVPLAEVAKISQHRTTAGLMSYVYALDHQTARQMSNASRAIHTL